MTRENAKDFLPLVEAWANGETLQIRFQGEWTDLRNVHFDSNPEDYRIKPKPKTVYVVEVRFGSMAAAMDFSANAMRLPHVIRADWPSEEQG